MFKISVKPKKILIIIISVLLMAVSVVPFLDASSGGSKIKLVVDLHGYRPSTSRVPTADDPDVFNSTYYIADAFMKENPDIEIVWARTKPVGGMDAEIAQWLTTQISGGTVPAIAFSWGTRYQERNWYLGLDEYLADEWTYEGDYKTWKDVFRDYLWESSMVVNAKGEVVGIPITVQPGAAAGYFYNKTAFQTAGINEIPKTWGTFIETTKKLAMSGYVGVAPWLYFNTTTTFDSWVFGSVMSPSYGGALIDVVDYDKNGTVDAAEQARATLAGVYSSRHEYSKEMFRSLRHYFKEMLEYGWSSIDYNAQWLNGNVGIREEGLWAIPNEDSNVVRDFDYGVFVAPLVSTDTSQFVKPVQYSIGPYKPQPDLVVNIMKGAVENNPKMLDAALRFLKYLTQPKNVSLICIENGGVLGAVKNTGHSRLIDDFIRGEFPIFPNAGWPSGFTDEYKDQLNRLFEKWANGTISDEAFFTQSDIIQVNGANAFIKSMQLDTSGWGN